MQYVFLFYCISFDVSGRANAGAGNLLPVRLHMRCTHPAGGLSGSGQFGCEAGLGLCAGLCTCHVVAPDGSDLPDATEKI